MVEGEKLLAMNLEECKVPLAKVIETIYASTTVALLKILAADLEVQLVKVEEACSADEAAMAEGAIAYIQELKQRLGPRVLN
jgi:hypothetical protein